MSEAPLQNGDRVLGSQSQLADETLEHIRERRDTKEEQRQDLREETVLSVIMPTLNEEGGIAECVKNIQTAFEELGIEGEIIVSDSSTDRTPEIARELGATVVEPDKPGYGYAYRYAFAHANGDYIAIGDADTTYDFTELPKLFRLVADGEADMAMGSRLEGEILPGAMPPLHQHIGNPLLTKFLNVFYGAGVSDAHSGMRVISRQALDELELTSSGMEFASEMIMEAGARGLTIKELPITYHPREGEATLDSFRDGWRHVRFMLVNAPGYLFSVPGAVIALVGLLVMGLAYGNVSVGSMSFGIHSMIAGSLLLLTGSQIGSLGIFSTVSSDPIQRPSDPITRKFTEEISLEQSATVGLVIFAVGALYAASLLINWIGSGFSTLPFIAADVIAFTAIVLGVQIIFSSFFLSSVAKGGKF